MRGAMKYLVIVGIGLCAGLVAHSARAQGMAGPSLSQAQAGLAAAEAAAVEMGIGLTCAVVDGGGTLVALARMDNARYFTSDIAVGKARASAALALRLAPCPTSPPWASRMSWRVEKTCCSSRVPCRSA